MGFKIFAKRAAISTLTGDIFDAAATGQGLLNFCLKAINCGAITEEEATATGLGLEEIQRSRVAMCANHHSLHLMQNCV